MMESLSRATTGEAVDAPSTLELLVSERALVAEDVVRLTLRRPDGGDLPQWSPGAHIDLEVHGGALRQYSLCGNPADRARWDVAVLWSRQGRGGSTFVHESVSADELIVVGTPRNNFPLVPAKAYVFIAGGIGVTPLVPMARQAEASGADWVLHYGGRDRRSMAFVDELIATYGPERIIVHAESEGPMMQAGELLALPQPDTHVYACGPGGLLDAVTQAMNNWPSGSLHLERFSAVPLDSATEQSGFDVVLNKSGRTLHVPPDKSILHTIADAGLYAPSSCEEGICGSCITTVLEGLPEHRDSVLSDEEREMGEEMLICVSRSQSDRLVLDL